MTPEERCAVLEHKLATLESRELLSREDVAKVADERLKAWVKSASKWLGIPSLAVAASCLLYVFLLLPHEAASIALSRHDSQVGKLEQDIMDVAKDIRTQEIGVEGVQERLANLDIQIGSEEEAVRDLLSVIEERQIELHGQLSDVASQVEEGESDVERAIEQHSTRMSAIDEEVRKFEDLVEQFAEERGGEALVDRMVRFTKLLETDEGIRRLDTLETELSAVKLGRFASIECQSLSVISGTDSGAGKVRLTIADDGAGLVETYDAAGNRLCEMGATSKGNGGFWTYAKDDSDGQARAVMFVDRHGGGRFKTFMAAGNITCSMGTGSHGGGFWAYEKDSASKARIAMYVSESDSGHVSLYDAADTRLCSIGASKNGNGGFWTYAKNGNSTGSLP